MSQAGSAVAVGSGGGSQPGARACGAPKIFGRKRAEVAVVTAVHEYAAWWTLKVAKFPKDIKHSLGQRSLELVLELLETLVEAAFVPAPERPPLLASANRQVERLRHLTRLAHATAALPHESYAHASAYLDDIGKQIGGWARAKQVPGASHGP